MTRSDRFSLYVVLSVSIVDQLKNKNRQKKNVIEVVQQLCAAIQKLPKKDRESGFAHSVNILREIAKGEDGLAGTEDDLIDADFLNELSMLTKTNMLTDLMHLFTQKPKSWTSRVLMFYKHYMLCTLR